MKILLFILTAASFIINIKSSGHVINEDISSVVDQLLSNIRDLIEADNFPQITVPGFSKFGLKCAPGTFSNLATIKRRGNFTISISGDESALITGTFGLDSFNLTYPDCTMMGIFKRSYQLTASEDQVTAQVAIHHVNNKCNAVLSSIELDILKNVRLDSGGGWFNVVENYLLKWFTEHYEQRLLKRIYKLLWNKAQMFSGKNLCSING